MRAARPKPRTTRSSAGADRARGIGSHRLRPDAGHVRPAAAGSSRSRTIRPSQPAGPRRRVAVPVGDLPDHRAATRGRDRYIAQLGTAHVPGARRHARRGLARVLPAEAYHQNYLELHPDAPYIAYNDMPKITGLKQHFPALYRTDAVLWRDARS